MDPNYQGLGQVLYSFQLARWNVVELGNMLNKSFIAKQGAADFVHTADDFDLLADMRPEWKPLSSGFLSATKRFSALLASTPYTTAAGQGALGSSDAGKYDWTDDELADFIRTLESLSGLAAELAARFSKVT